MIIGYNSYGDSSAIFNTSGAINNFYELDLSDSIVDEVNMDSDINLVFSSNYPSWGSTTIMDAKFKGNLSAGSLDNYGTPIQQVLVRRRLTNSLIWQNVTYFNYNPNQKIYTFIDNLLQSQQNYEYAITPVSASGVLGNSVTAQITSQFEGTFISDVINNYKLFYNLQYGDVENVFTTTILETFDQYPTILCSPLKYRKGNIKSQILSANTISSNDIDPQSERINLDNMADFFTNKLPKILRDYAGRYYLIQVLTYKESPNNLLAQTIAEVNFDWTEIGDATNLQTLINAGLSF